jgi:hypothetical protein
MLKDVKQMLNTNLFKTNILSLHHKTKQLWKQNY